MKASARIVAEADPTGATRLTTLAGQAPLLLRRTGTRGPTATVQLVGGAAGPIGGDQLDCLVAVGGGAGVRVESVAASVALPGTGGGQSRLDIRVQVAAGGSLVWSPQPLIAARGARHRTESRIDLGAGARLSWREEIVLGRSGEVPGSIAARLRVRRAGRPLIDHDVALGPEHPGSLGPAVTGGRRAVGTALIVDPAWEGVDGRDRLPGIAEDCVAWSDESGSIAALPLTGPAVLLSAIAADGLILSRLLDRVIVPFQTLRRDA
ncbi:MAG: urease accessory protein UreD [Catenulispora sp.]